MTERLIDLEPSMWRTIADIVASMTDLDELDGAAVWFRAAGGRCAFIVQSPMSVAMVFGGEWADDDLEVPLSPRFVRFVGAQFRAELTPERCPEVTVLGDRVAVFRGDHAGTGTELEVAVDLVRDANEPFLPDLPESGCSIDVDASSAAAALGFLRTMPPGSTSSTGGPLLWLGVETDGELTMSVDWSDFGLGQSSCRLPALTDGRRMLSIPHEAVASVLAVAHTDGDVPSIDLPMSRQGLLAMRTSRWCAWFPCFDTSVARWQSVLRAALDRAGRHHQPIDDVTLAITSGETPVLAELHTTSMEAVRISKVLAEGVAVSETTLQEVNAANRGLVDVRLWLDGDRLVVGRDLPCTRIDEVVPAITGLELQVAGFGVFIGALS